MKKWKIEFKHTVEQTYETIIEAETQEEAEKIFDEDPFGNDVGDPINEQGLTIELEEINEID